MRQFLLIPITIISMGLILKGVSEIRFRPVLQEFNYKLQDSPSIKTLLQKKMDCQRIEPVVYKKLPDLSGLHPTIRKKVFIRLLLPAVLIAKKKVHLQRTLVLKIARKKKLGLPLSLGEEAYLNKLMKQYKARNIKVLLTRLRTHPTSLILAQAAVESGWGTSRFTKEANNIFGIWQFKGKSGLKARGSNARLRRYDNILQSIEEYLYNLNAGWAYEDFRRARLYTDNPFALVEHLTNYSILRHEYTQRLKAVINHNKLHRYDQCRLENN